MGAEALLREVEERRKKALEQLEAEYAGKKSALAKHNSEEIASIAESERKEVVTMTERERTRISGAAKLQAKKMLFDATEKMLENNILALRQSLAEYSDSKEYPDVLARMARYATRRLGQGVGVVCRQSDVAILKKAGARVISSDLKSIGGFRAESENGNLELDLTFEEILRSHEEETRAYILGKE